MKKILLLIVMVFAFVVNASAQSWLKRLGERAVDRAKYKVERKAEDAVDRAIDGVEDEATDAVKGKKGKDKKAKNDDADEDEGYVQESMDAAPVKQKKVAKGEEVKSDFVPGSVVIFEDNLQGGFDGQH